MQVSVKISVLAISVVIAIIGAPGVAQMVRSAESGTVNLQFDPPTGLENPITVSSGDLVWTSIARPLHVVRLLDEAPERIRPQKGHVVAQGSLLWGLQLNGGLAYCPSIDYDAPVARVQCFRDFNDDSVFDGRYLSRQYGNNSSLLPAFVRALAPSLQMRFEPADPGHTLDVVIRVNFDRWHRNQAQFRIWIEGERLDNRLTCEPINNRPGLCTLRGLTLQITQINNQTSITLIDVQANRIGGIISQWTG